MTASGNEKSGRGNPRVREDGRKTEKTLSRDFRGRKKIKKGKSGSNGPSGEEGEKETEKFWEITNRHQEMNRTNGGEERPGLEGAMW